MGMGTKIIEPNYILNYAIRKSGKCNYDMRFQFTQNTDRNVNIKKFTLQVLGVGETPLGIATHAHK